MFSTREEVQEGAKAVVKAAGQAPRNHVVREKAADRDLFMHYRLAISADAAELLQWMNDFNDGEGIAWNAEVAQTALETLLFDNQLGVVGRLEEGGNPIGYFVVTWGYDLEWNGRDAFLTELYIVPQARGRGLGRAALALAEEVARDHGAHALHLMVRPENASARRLYEAAGYRSPPRIFMTKAMPKR
jgi:ribosomal protein S18 acetylase RimI-like enzyme